MVETDQHQWIDPCRRDSSPKDFSYLFGWPDVDDGPWDCRLVFSPINERMEPVALHIRHRSDAVPLTTGVLRDLKLASIARRARDDIISAEPAGLTVDELVQEYGEDTRESWEQQRAKAEEDIDMMMRRFQASRTRFYPPGHYAWVAVTYKEAYKAGANPVAYVQRQYELKEGVKITRRQASYWVEVCRHKLGLLPPTEKRKAKA